MILRLGDTNGFQVGGKAQGLSELILLGLNVPPGFVVIAEHDADWKKELEAAIQLSIHIPKAVRSSAAEEDGNTASFAGQFETYLNCNGLEAVIEAAEKCWQSSAKERVSAYSQHFEKQIEQSIPIIVQDMVNARKAGVLFTANPVNQRRDQWVINVTEGLGEKLVGGTESGEYYLLSGKGRVLQKGTLLNEKEVNQLYNQALKISQHLGMPVDLEWAIDTDGKLFWLQARPISTLKDTHMNELDDMLRVPDELFTRGNIGEMMPGPVTPLTYSVFGRGIETGLQDFYIACGAQKKFTDEWLYFSLFYNHLFFSMSSMYKITEHVLLNKKENVEFAIMGEILDNDVTIQKAPLPKRILNQFRQFRYLSSGIKRMHKLEKISQSFSIDLTRDLDSLYKAISDSGDILNTSYAHHYCTSSQSGSYNSALMQILSRGKPIPSVNDHRNASSLLVDINGIEGANLIFALENLVNRFREDDTIREWLLTVDDHEFKMLVHGDIKPGSEPLGNFLQVFSEFLDVHGHRCIREAELREKSWSEEPVQLLRIIKKQIESVGIGNQKNKTFVKNKNQVFKALNPIQRIILNSVLPRARAAVARREYTKSLCIKIQHRIKTAYIKLAELMVYKGMLDDADQVFFLTHKELGSYLASGDQKWKKKAIERRDQFPDSFKLQFKDVCTGIPEPLEENFKPEKINGNSISGIPVSAGKVEGQIRVIRNIKDANKLQHGDIMVCQYTDIGWTPYFTMLSGLVTEIGSPLSHGAVVAREYGIPAVVSVKGAMHFFADNDKVVLDGKTGIIKKTA